MSRGVVFGLLVLGVALSVARAEPPVAEPTTTRTRLRSQSLDTVCAGLTERLGVTVATERSQADLRILWPDPDSTSLSASLTRLAELTDSRVVHDPAHGRDRYTLERKFTTARREQLWEASALRGALGRLAQAYARIERGDRRAAAAAGAGSLYLGFEHSQLGARVLPTLTLEQVRTLVAGEEVRVAPELFTEAEQKRLVRSVARRGWPAEQEETDEDDDPRTLLNLDYLRRYGLGVRVDRDGSEEGGAKLTMVFAPPGQSFSTFTVGIFPDQDLGQPLTRSNPFRDLEQRVPRRLPVAQLSARLREPLGAPLVVPSGASWRMALAAFTKASGLPVASDDYLCRVVSFPPAQGEPVLSVDRGVPTAEALDRMCEAYRYLWWEMDGCCYFRSRCWPRDMETEVPPRVVEQLAGTLQRQGQLGAEEIVAVFHLTKRQLGGLFRLGISGAGPNGFINPSLPGFLRWFAGLPPAHQAAIVGEGATVIVNDSSMLPGVTRKMLGEPLWVHLQQAATRIPAKNPLGWRLALTLQTAPAGNSTQASSSFYNLNVPNPDAEPAPAGVGSEPEPPQ